jgi:hypothetical protein
MNSRPSPTEEVQRLYEEAESRTAKAMETLVARDSFGELLAKVTENVMSLTKIGNEAMDMAVRNLRVAGRQDLIRLGRQLARTEDKLELVLQEVETLQDELRASRNGDSPGATDSKAPARKTAGSSR